MCTTEICCDEWVTAKTAAKWLGCPLSAVRRLARAGHITMRVIPTCDLRYLASDLERLARESTRPALKREATTAATL